MIIRLWSFVEEVGAGKFSLISETGRGERGCIFENSVIFCFTIQNPEVASKIPINPKNVGTINSTFKNTDIPITTLRVHHQIATSPNTAIPISARQKRSCRSILHAAALCHKSPMFNFRRKNEIISRKPMNAYCKLYFIMASKNLLVLPPDATRFLIRPVLLISLDFSSKA